MKQITTNGKDWLFVEIPEDANNLQIHRQIQFNVTVNNVFGEVDVSEGDWVFFATTDHVTEEQADMIVQRSLNAKYYIHYTFSGITDKVTESFKSFLTHHNLTGRYAILRKI
jgi:hypothetical protein